MYKITTCYSYQQDPSILQTDIELLQDAIDIARDELNLVLMNVNDNIPKLLRSDMMKPHVTKLWNSDPVYLFNTKRNIDSFTCFLTTTIAQEFPTFPTNELIYWIDVSPMNEHPMKQNPLDIQIDQYLKYVSKGTDLPTFYSNLESYRNNTQLALKASKEILTTLQNIFKGVL